MPPPPLLDPVITELYPSATVIMISNHRAAYPETLSHSFGDKWIFLFKKVMNACGLQYGILFRGGRHRCRQDGFRDGRACSLN